MKREKERKRERERERLSVVMSLVAYFMSNGPNCFLHLGLKYPGINKKKRKKRKKKSFVTICRDSKASPGLPASQQKEKRHSDHNQNLELEARARRAGCKTRNIL